MDKTLKILIVIEIGLIIASIASEFALESFLPGELRNYLERADEHVSFIKLTSAGLLLLVLVLFIVAWIQMWRLKRNGRILYAVAWGCSLPLMIPLGPYVQSGFTYALDVLSALVSGIILGIAYFSDLRLKFT